VSTTWTMPRESREWVGPLTVTANGVPTLTYQVSVVHGADRPTRWAAPDPLGGQLGVLVGPTATWPLAPGQYSIWVQVTSAGEAPVLDDVGTITVT
jgi:hypothetical protein